MRKSLGSSLLVVGLLVLFNNGITSCTAKRPQSASLAVNVVPLASIAIVATEPTAVDQFNLEVKTFTTGKLCFDAVLGGGAEFGTVAETPLTLAALANQPFQVLATIAYSNNDCKVIARKDRGINSPADLRGRKVATFIGTSAEFFMHSFLKAQGLSAKDLQVTTLQPPDMVTALSNGDIDAFLFGSLTSL